MSLPPALVQRFTAHLAALRGEVAALAPRLAPPHAEADARERLRGLSHQLAGTADGYGFPVVGAGARRVEAALTDDDPGLPALVRALEDALAQAVSAGTV